MFLIYLMFFFLSLPPQTSVPKVEEVTGPYRLDPELMAKLDAIKIQSHKPKLQQFDLTFLDEEIKVPAFFKDKMKYAFASFKLLCV